MKTPVFDSDHKILGYLEHRDEDARQRYLCFRCEREHRKWASLTDWQPRDLTANRLDEAHLLPTVQTVQFQWGEICASRTGSHMSLCRVLITSDGPDRLNRLKGFKWFAEEHGQPVKLAVSNA